MSKQDITFIHDMLSKMDGRLDEMNNTLVRHDENLKEHMRRTALLEKELLPVKRHVHMVQGVGVFIGLLALVATILAVFK